jgi:hypothetical protein
MVKYLDKSIYMKAKEIVYKQYDKPSAYRSMALVKKYKDMGGRLEKDGSGSGLKIWSVQERWKNLTPYAEGLTSDRFQYKCGQRAPNQKGPSVCRPSAEVKKYSKNQIKRAVEIKSDGKIIKWDKL